MANIPMRMGPAHISAGGATVKYEVQRTNQFEISIDGLGTDIVLAVDSFSLPSTSNDPIELAYGNAKVKVAGQATYDDVDLVVKDFIDVDVEAQLYAWRQKVYDAKTDKMGWAKDYKKDGTVYQYGPDGTAIRAWKLEGLWPTNFQPGELNYDGGDKKVITMTLSVDRAYPIDRPLLET